MNKKIVAIAMGGYSSEYEISLQSGKIVAQALQDSYEVYPVLILKDGWYSLDSNGNRESINKADFSIKTKGKTIVPDVVFNTIHGTPGEDGYMAAFWELLGIPQTSSSFYAAALSFNKRDCLSVLQNFGIKMANSYYVNKGAEINLDDIVKTVGLPCFVKPNRAGSSFGITKVRELDQMEAALAHAFDEDHEVIVETALIGTEVSVGVYKKQGELIVLPPTEIVSENDFFDYEAKYMGKSAEITPARISEEDTLKVQTEAKKIYYLLNMMGVARAEFIIQDGVPYFLEINSTPGLSSESIIPKQVREAGMDLTEFFSILVEEALKKS